ncbi:MAG: polymerase, sigma-24 subunit, subfamily [Ilumatobacteraceae bacterium]|nr:polymerase, sigma-24 subunit, subfamily [Ilumatobacteraceae bacterium]
MRNLDDAALLRLADADAGAFREVYDRHAVAILGFFKRRGVDHHTALDLTAETFAEAWSCRGRFVDQVEGSAGPWLSGIARNVLSHAARHRAVVTAARERLQMTVEPRPIDHETEVLLARLDGVDPALLRGLDDLPDASRAAVEARVVHGRTYDEIATTLRCTPLAARIKVSRALTALRSDPTLAHLASSLGTQLNTTVTNTTGEIA